MNSQILDIQVYSLNVHFLALCTRPGKPGFILVDVIVRVIETIKETYLCNGEMAFRNNFDCVSSISY